MARPVALQASLFAGDAPQPDASGRLEARALDERSWVDWCPGWPAGPDTLFDELRVTAPWVQRERRMYQGTVLEPRLTAWWSAGDDVPAAVSVEPIRVLLSQRYGVDLDAIGLNLYRDGATRWRGRAEEGDCPGPALRHRPAAGRAFARAPGSRSLGSNGGPASTVAYDVVGGDLLVMGGECQRPGRGRLPAARSPSTCHGQPWVTEAGHR